MKQTAIFCLILAVFTSCATQKICNRKFPVIADTVEVVYYRDSIIFRDTVISVFLPGDMITQIDSVIIPCPPPPPQFKPDTARAETSLAVALAWWDHPYIRLSLVQHDTTILVRLDSAIREAYYWKKQYNTVIVPKEQKIPKIYKIALWSWIGFFVLIILSFIKYLYRRK